MAFLDATLAAAAGRPVAMFTHAPPLGSGLKVLQVRTACHCKHCALTEGGLRFVSRLHLTMKTTGPTLPGLLLLDGWRQRPCVLPVLAG